jgi:hypothetical protein
MAIQPDSVSVKLSTAGDRKDKAALCRLPSKATYPSYPSGGGVLAGEKQNGMIDFSKAAVVMPFESSLTKAPASLLPETTQRFFIACFARSARMALPYCTWQRRGAIRIWCNCCWPIKPRSMPGALAVARLWARRCVQAAVT